MTWFLPRPRALSARRPAPRRTPQLEALEDRNLLSFSGPEFINTSSPPGLVLAADFNADGFADLAVPNPAGAGVLCFLNDGRGAFAPVAGSTDAAFATAFVSGSFNADSHLDIAAITSAGELQLLFGDGQGGFSAGTPIAVLPEDSALFSSIQGLAAGFLNGDAFMDLVLTGDGTQGVQRLFGDGAGNFTQSGLLVGPVYGAPVFTDLNADGKHDLALLQADTDPDTGAVTTKVAVYPGDGTGEFGTLTGSPFVLTDGGGGLVAGQFAGNAALDLAILSGNQVTLLIGQGSGTAATYTLGSPTTITTTASVSSVVALDYPSGYDGLAFTTSPLQTFESTLVSFRGSAGGLTGREETPSFPHFTATLTAGDFDADGAPDLATATFGGGLFLEPDGVYTFRNDDAGTPPTDVPRVRSPNLVTYRDVDGDPVAVRSNKPIFDEATLNSVFTLVPAGMGYQLQRINLNALSRPQKARGSTLTVTAGMNAATGGDGRVNVGSVEALLDLRTVDIRGDLGAIAVGDLDSRTQALGLLKLNSFGTMGLTTQGANGTLQSLIFGKLGRLQVAGDVDGVRVQVTGSREADGAVGRVSIGGALVGRGAERSGALEATGHIGALTVLGSILGGAGDYSGSVLCGSAGTVELYGSFVGQDGQTKSILGSSGNNSGRLFVGGHTETLFVAGDVEGGSQDASGRIFTSTAGSVYIGGSLIGGDGDSSGTFSSFSGTNDTVGLEALHISGEVRGGGGEDSGRISLYTRVVKVVVEGALIGGTGRDSGGLLATLNVDTITVGGVRGGSGPQSGRLLLDGTFFPSAKSIRIKGSVESGPGVNPPPGSSLGISSMIGVAGTVGTLTVDGAVVGTADQPALIRVTGAGATVALKTLTVKGRVEFAQVVAVAGGIGSIKVAGDWVASSAAASVSDGDDRYFGTDDDTVISNAAHPARIKSVVIGGHVVGDAGGGFYGFVAEQIDAVTIAGVVLGLRRGPHHGYVLVPGTDDVGVYEL